MSHFMTETLSDLRGGRETWRVRVAFAVASFAVAFGTTLIRLG